MRPMRTRIVLGACVLVLAVPAVAAAIERTGEFKAGFAATTHNPTVNAKWPFVVSAKTLSGRPLKASVHLQVFLNGKRVDVLPLKADGTAGTMTDVLADRYGRLRTVVLDSDGALWITTSNRDGFGTPTADDDRVLRIVPPTSSGNSPL